MHSERSDSKDETVLFLVLKGASVVRTEFYLMERESRSLIISGAPHRWRVSTALKKCSGVDLATGAKRQKS